MEKFLILFEKTFSGHYENTLKEENTEKNVNLDSEKGIVSDILTKLLKTSENIHSEEEAREKVNKARKFLKIIDSFFHSIFDSK